MSGTLTLCVPLMERMAPLTPLMPLVRFRGAPVVKFVIDDSDHPSTARLMKAGPDARNRLPGPNGNSQLPCALTVCVRSKLSLLLFADSGFRGSNAIAASRTPVLPLIASPSALDHM